MNEMSIQQQQAIALARARIRLSQTKEPTGFIDRTVANISNRADEFNTITDSDLNQNQSPPETAWQLATKTGLGTINDVIAEGVGAGYRGLMSFAPENVKRGESVIKQAIAPAASAIGEKYSQFSQNNPRAARNIEGLANLVGFATPVKGKSVANTIVKPVIEKPIEGVANIGRGVAARSPESLDETANTLKSVANASYKKSKQFGAVLNKNRAVNIGNRITNAVKNSGKLNVRLHGDTLSVLEDIKNGVKNPLSLEELDQYRQLLGDVVNKNTDALKGANPDARLASIAIDELDDAVEKLDSIDIVGGKREAVDSLLEGREQWKKFRKFQAVSQIVKNSNGDPNLLKSGFKRFLNKPKNLRGFNDKEIATLKAASRNSLNDQIMKGLGRFGISPSNVFLPLMGGAVGGGAAALGASTLGVGAAGVIGAGTVTRQLYKYSARGKAEKALKEIGQ